MNALKYLKVLLYVFIPILVLNAIISIFYYFNILGDGAVDYLKLIVIALSMLAGGIYIGSKATKKGWLEGLKIGLEVILIIFTISYLAFDKAVDIRNVIYYFILLISSMLGSMVGINKRKRTS